MPPNPGGWNPCGDSWGPPVVIGMQDAHGGTRGPRSEDQRRPLSWEPPTVRGGCYTPPLKAGHRTHRRRWSADDVAPVLWSRSRQRLTPHATEACSRTSLGGGLRQEAWRLPPGAWVSRAHVSVSHNPDGGCWHAGASTGPFYVLFGRSPGVTVRQQMTEESSSTFPGPRQHGCGIPGGVASGGNEDELRCQAAGGGSAVGSPEHLPGRSGRPGSLPSRSQPGAREGKYSGYTRSSSWLWRRVCSLNYRWKASGPVT